MNGKLFLAICGALVAVAGVERAALAQKRTSIYKAPSVAAKPAPEPEESKPTADKAVPAADKAEPAAVAVLAEASAANKFTFLLFYKDDSSASRTMRDVVEEGVAARSDKAMMTLVQMTDPDNAALVEKFAVSRSPMPLTLVVAPNGAITGIFAKQVLDEHLDTALVTPTMTKCMKSLQENKLVFVCVRSTPKAAVPPCVKELQADPEFKDRVMLVSLRTNDPNEGRFYEQMKLDPATVDGAIAVLLAPPGVLIGKYDAAATGDEVAIALNKAGKCCDDPNCKHNKGVNNKGVTQPQAKKPAPAKRGAR